MIVLCVVLAISTRLHAEPRDSDAAQSELRRAREAAVSLSIHADRIHGWLRQARERRLVARSRCLDALLSQAHAAERQGALELAAIARADVEERRAYLVRLGHTVARSRRILTQASLCGKAVSRRVRAPTQYRVRLVANR